MLQQLEEARRIETGQRNRPHIGDIVVGNRVMITKCVHNPNERNVTNADRLPTVTRTDKKKV